MAEIALIGAKSELHFRRNPRLRSQPWLLRLLFQSRLRLLLERRSETPAVRRSGLHRDLRHPLGDEAGLGTAHGRVSGERVPPAAVFRAGRRRWDGVGAGTGGEGRIRGFGGSRVFDWSFGGDGDCRCDD